MNKASTIVLRRFALQFDEGKYQSLDGLEFSYMDIMDVLDDTEHYNDTTAEVLERLEFEKCIKVSVRAGEDSSYTRFTLTEKGFHIGLPEKSQRSGFYLSIIRSSFIFSLTSLGIIGGPLALAGLFKNLITWKDPILWLIDIWQSNISTPIMELLQVLLSFIGIHHLPVWIGDYVSLGVLVSTSTLNASRVQKEYSSLPDNIPLSSTDKIKSYLWLYLINTFIWPISLFFELIASLSLMSMYFFNGMSIKVKTAINKQMIFARFFTFVVPIVLFGLLFVMNIFYK